MSATHEWPAAGAGASADVEVVRNFIGGAWVDVRDAERLPVYNPALGLAIASVPLSTARHVGDAVAAASAACEGWRETPVVLRARVST